MIYREHFNGRLSMPFRRFAIDGSGIKYSIGDVCYDLFQSVPLGRIHRFISENGNIYAIIQGKPYDISELYKDA